MKIHISGRTIDAGSIPTTRHTADGDVFLTLYDIILSCGKLPDAGSAPKLHSPCGGHLKCKKCTVCAVIEEDTFEEFAAGDYAVFHRDFTESEKTAMFDSMHVPAELRSRTVIALACAMFAFPAITDVYLPDPEEIHGASSDGVLLNSAKAPVVLSKSITLTKPTVANPIDVHTNLYQAIFCGESPITAADFGYDQQEYTVIRSISDEVLDFTARYLQTDDCPLSMNVAVTCAPMKEAKTIRLTAAVVLSIPPCSIVFRNIVPLGLAVDLGTTTVALSLWNLETGNQIAAKVITNPQRSFGADVISRMSYASEHGVLQLQETVHEAIRNTVLELLPEFDSQENPADLLNNILYVTVAGNSVMEHLFCGIPTDSISKAPFYMTTSLGCAYPAGSFCKSIFCHPDAPVYLAPLAASYIGGDITMGLAYLLEAYPQAKNDRSLFLDLGTNGEICVISDEKFLLAATAAGPALEGAHIKMGMSAVSGAITGVKIPSDPSGEFEIRSIGGNSPGVNSAGENSAGENSPIGICGSGLIDAIACCLETGLITEYGRICDDGEAEDEAYEEMYQIFEHKISETDDGKLQIALTDSVFLHESDIRQVQTAKAAIAAGSQTLLSNADLTDDSLDRVYLAGSFGGGINPVSSARIGLLSDVSPEIITAVGNTSAKGAAAFMLYPSVRNSLETVMKSARYTELSGSPEFNELYVDNMIFGLPE